MTAGEVLPLEFMGLRRAGVSVRYGLSTFGFRDQIAMEMRHRIIPLHLPLAVLERQMRDSGIADRAQAERVDATGE